MSVRSEARRGAQVVWGAVRGRFPAAAPIAGAAREAVRTPAGRSRRVAELAARVHELERDQVLLAAQVAALGTAAESEDPAGPEVADRVAAARLQAVALYEHRIAELERRVLRRRDTPGPRVPGRTADEFEEAGR